MIENGSWQLIGLYDIHLDPERDRFHPAYLAARQYVVDVKPKQLLFGGDMGTFDSLSNWNLKKPLIAEGKRYKDDIEVVIDELNYYRMKLPSTEFIYVIGNHEERIKWYVQKNPGMFGFMDQIKDLRLEKYCQYIVHFDKHVTIGKCSYAHGWYWNKYHAAKTLHEFGDNIIYGHVHHRQTHSRNIHFGQKPQIAMSVPCLTDRYPEYRGAKPSRHQNGFVTVNYRWDGTFSADVHQIYDGAFSYAKHTWRG